MIGIQTYGYINKNNNDILEWNGNYNSIKDKGDIKVTIKKGNKTKKNHYKINNLDNNFPINILGFNPVKKPLDQRLEQDFFQTSIPIYEPLTLDGALIEPRKRLSSRKKHTNNKKKKSHKRRK